MIEFKQSIYSNLLQLQDQKISQLQLALDSLYNDLSSESKSSSGDKHETGRAMIQLEQEQLGKLLQEARLQKSALSQLDINNKRESITNGSLVNANNTWYFICSTPVKITIDSTIVYCISLNSPIGKLFAGKKPSEKVIFNGSTMLISDIY